MIKKIKEFEFAYDSKALLCATVLVNSCTRFKLDKLLFAKVGQFRTIFRKIQNVNKS